MTYLIEVSGIWQKIVDRNVVEQWAGVILSWIGVCKKGVIHKPCA